MTKDEAIDLLDAMKARREVFPAHLKLKLIQSERVTEITDEDGTSLGTVRKPEWGVGIRDDGKDTMIHLYTPGEVGTFMGQYLEQLRAARERATG